MELEDAWLLKFRLILTFCVGELGRPRCKLLGVGVEVDDGWAFIVEDIWCSILSTWLSDPAEEI